MRIFKEPEDLKEQCRAWRAQGQSLALAPTMGYYHAGHKALISKARQLGDRLVVSLFVNPAQFGPGEDLAAYPRDFAGDCAIAEELGADALFAPTPEAMYSQRHATWVEAPELAKGLCGASRPAHFRGVCTVVLKLLMLTGADFAVFGEKDWQQLAIIRRMAADLNLPIQIESVPIVREADGLALSSRNVYLTERERAQASGIRAGLLAAKELARAGEKDASALKAATLSLWREKMPDARPDYLEIVHPETLAPLARLDGPGLMACAVYLGRARLIDNITLAEE